MAFQKIQNARNGSMPGRLIEKGSVITFTENSNAHYNQQTSVSIQISLDDMIMMRWVVGDKVDVMIDFEKPNMVYIKRHKNGQLTLSSSEGIMGKGKLKKAKLKFNKPTFINATKGDIFHAILSEDIDGGLMLTLDKCIDFQ